jgi:hypothetical protein
VRVATPGPLLRLLFRASYALLPSNNRDGCKRLETNNCRRSETHQDFLKMSRAYFNQKSRRSLLILLYELQDY